VFFFVSLMIGIRFVPLSREFVPAGRTDPVRLPAEGLQGVYLMRGKKRAVVNRLFALIEPA
jgi:hypothetical protein